VALSAAFVAGLGLALPAFAADPPRHGGAGGGARSMPPRGYHNAPPNFRGNLPRAGRPGVAPRGGVSRPFRNFGTFRGRSFSGLTPRDRLDWQRGSWRHVMRNGHLGWWWVAGGLWYYYPAPIYPYPMYIGPTAYYDYYSQYGTPDYYWYYCEDPMGYYPYVQQCNGPWEPVPPTPQTP
jgi:hypothetical protein